MGKKNKRGERGSTEEDSRTAKKSNMATKEVSIHADQDEPTLLEIKEMLVDIQISIASVVKENQALKEEIEDLKDSVNFNEKELQDLKESLQKTKDENKVLRNLLDATKNQMKATKENLEAQKQESDRLYEELDSLEQYTRKNSLEIRGIPDNAYPNTEVAIIKVAEALNITIEPEDIEISHKLKHGRGIVVKFCNHKIKSKLYKERTKLKDVRISDIFPGYPCYGQQQQRIFINESLTAYRRGILSEANKRRRDGVLVSVWTLDGKIFAKASPDGSPIRIFSEEQLDNL